MTIYCIILSPQHKCCSASVTACQVGLGKTAPAAAEIALTALCSKCADSGHQAPYGTAGWGCGGRRHVLPSLSYHQCVHFLAFVCAFLLVTGWPTAVLESLLTESVGSAGYFYPLACVGEQVEALWDWNKVTWWRLPLCDYLKLLWPNVKVCECPFYKDTACDVGQASAAEWKSLISTTQQSPGNGITQVNPEKKPPNITSGVVYSRRITLYRAAGPKLMRKSVKILLCCILLQGLN